MTEAAVVAIGRALVWAFAWLATLAGARNALTIWIRFKEDQAALDRAQARGLIGWDPDGTLPSGTPPATNGDKLGVVQHVPRETLTSLRGNRERLSALSRPGDVVVPEDLEAHCAQWEDAWARDDERATVRAKFVELYSGDAAETWQRVRRAVGIGELP